MKKLCVFLVLCAGCQSGRYAVNVETDLRHPSRINIGIQPVDVDLQPPTIDLRNCKPIRPHIYNPNDKVA